MAILEKLKSLLGLDDAGSERQGDRDIGVTVERGSGRSDEPTDAADETAVAPPEAAEPTTDAAASETETIDEPDESPIDEAEPDESEADETEPDESESDETESDESEAGNGAEIDVSDELDTADEPGEAAGPTTDDVTPEADSSGSQDEDEPVDVIKGIGPAYADRLEGAGVETVSDLATADADALTGETDISATRIQGWIDRAKVR